MCHDSVARKYLGKNAVRVKESYDAKRNLTHYKPGDLVWYANPGSQLGFSTKAKSAIPRSLFGFSKNRRNWTIKFKLDAKG